MISVRSTLALLLSALDGGADELDSEALRDRCEFGGVSAAECDTSCEPLPELPSSVLMAPYDAMRSTSCYTDVFRKTLSFLRAKLSK